MDRPPEQVSFHATAAPDAEKKHPAGTPEYNEIALMSLGEVAARMFLIMPSEEPPLCGSETLLDTP
jgi:hypothetical protein